MTLTTTNNQLALPSMQEMQQLIEVSKVLASAPYYQKLGPSGVLAIWLTAKEIGLPVMACLNGGMFTFDGKVTISAQMMNYLIVSKGHRVDILTLTEQECKLALVRSDRTPETATYIHTFTMHDAQKADLLKKDNWKKYPKDMLFARCLASGARKHMPDVLLNLYTPEELEKDPVQVLSRPNNSTNYTPLQPVDHLATTEPKIIYEQLQKLLELWPTTTAKFQKNLLAYMEKEWGILQFADIPASKYKSVLESMERNRDLQPTTTDPVIEDQSETV